MRVFICGGPRTGKSHHGRELAAALRLPLVSTDDYLHLPPGDVPDAVLRDLPAHYVLEGVWVARVLRRLLDSGTSPHDAEAWWMTENWGQEQKHSPMLKGVTTVWRQIRPRLEAAGVPIYYR